MAEETVKSRILVVDDERFNRNLLADLLKPNHTVVLAKSGSQALDKAASKPDLILLDIMMPDMDGYEVCRRLKAEPATRDIPVIFVTSMQDPEDEMKGLEIGAIDYITKPFSTPIVRARVRNHLELQQARRKVAEARDKTAALLDNSGQGFLSFGPELMVDSEYSRECLTIFGREIKGASIRELFFPEDKHAGDLLEKNLWRIFAEKDQYVRSLYLSLMQKEYSLDVRRLAADYRMIAPARLMLILTDITLQRELETRMVEERNRLAFVVSAVRDSREFFEALESFRGFSHEKLPSLLNSGEDPGKTLSEIVREVHTFKGLFSQLDFIHLPAILHQLESKLRGLSQSEKECELSSDERFCDTNDLEEALHQDEAVLTETLGRDFFDRGACVTLSSSTARRLKSLVAELLKGPAAGLLDRDAKQLLEELRRIGHLDFNDLMSFHPRAVQRLAQRQGKQVAPFRIEGDSVLVDPQIYAPIAKVLLHLFRNAVDHGIEPPDERELGGKPPTAHIGCRVERRDQWLIVTISDDGRGLDPAAIRQRAVKLGLCREEKAGDLSAEEIMAILCSDGFSTKEDADEVSGRGVGLSAVKAELHRVGGSLELDAYPGPEVRWICRLPVPFEESHP